MKHATWFVVQSNLKNSNNMITKETTYETPSMEIYEVLAEGVLCSSPGNEGVGEEEGNGGFN